MYRRYYTPYESTFPENNENSNQDLDNNSKIEENSQLIVPEKRTEDDTPAIRGLRPNPFSFMSNLKVDDIILIALIIILLMDDVEDKTILIVLAFLFIAGFIDI
ncbi:MAG: hypothetical protein GX196_03420 [Clostridiaceae bacterium]|nr:hypothetical protein [Clostridiaceae bacterium]